MDNLDQLQAKLDKILNPSMPEPVAIPEVKAQPIHPMYYQIAAGMGNNDGAATMSPVEKDLRTLTPNQLYAKYGEENANYMLGNLARASGELQRNNLAERSWGETALDSTTGAGNAFVGGLGSIVGWGAGKVDAETGIAITDVVESLRKFTEENQSDALNARRKVGAIRDSLTQRDSDAQYNLDIKNGDSTTAAGFNQFTRDIGNSSVFDDSTLLAQGVADAIGSFVTAYPVGAAIKGAAKLLVPKATVRGIGLSGAMDAELGKWTVNRALSNSDKLVWPAAIGTLESGGTYQQTVEDATNTLKQQGKTVGDKLELINATAQQAADRMFVPAAGLGTITRFGEKPFHVPSLRQGATNILGREAPEEAGQGAVGTILSNQAIQDKIDPNRKTGEGVAQATVQGAVYGSLAAGTVQAPGLAKQSVISAAKATLGYVDKRTALAAEKADDASPVGTKALKAKASSLVPNAEPVKQTLAAELSGTDLTPEEKDQGIKYANDLVDSLKVSVENEFDDTIPPELSAIISGSEHRIDAIQQLAKKVITTSDPNDKLHTAATMYQLLQPILDLQTNRPSSVDNLSPESQVVLREYESLIANVNNSPTIKNAMKQIHDIMVAQGATVISPIMEEELNTPAGKQKVNAIITAASIAPDQGNLDATESILKHAKEGKLNLTPEQTTTLNASVALLRARKELEEKNKQFGLNASDIVSSEILTDRGVKDNNARSATQYTQEILSAVRRGNTLGATQLLYDMGLFVQHMKNKVEAINKHYLNGNPKAAPVPYEALLPTTHQWVDSATNPKAIHKGGFVNTLSPGSIKFVQGVELEHKILADVFNSLTEVFPDLGIDRIEPLQLEKGISGAVRRTTQEATKPVVKEEEEINYELLTKKPIDDLTLNEWSVIFGNIQGKVNTDGANDSIGIDDVILLNKLVKKIITDGVNKQQSRESIISRIDQTTKGGISTTAMQRIHALLDNNLKEKPEVKVVEPKQETKQTNEISSNARGLLAALTNPTELAKSKGNIEKSYPVNFNGKTYKDAEEAYQKLKHLATKDTGSNSTYSLMVDIIKAKLEQYPELVSGITKHGGSDWILSSTHQPTKQNSVWETGGKNWFIKALNEAYVSQIKPVVKTEEQPKVVEPKVDAAEVTDEERLNAKKAIYSAYKDTGYPDDSAAVSVSNVQNKANEKGVPFNVWRAEGGTLAVVPASQKSPVTNGKLIGTIHPETATKEDIVPLKPDFKGKVILAHAGTGKSFATKSNPDLIDGDVLYYEATNTIVDKYNKQNGETVPNIKDVTGTKGVFTAWGEYDKTNPERQAEAVRRRNEIYAEYAKQARALADAGKTVLSSSIREELIAVADMVVIQNDAKFIAENLKSAERVNQNSETNDVKIQQKINKAIGVDGRSNANGDKIVVHRLGTREYISDLIFNKAPAKVIPVETKTEPVTFTGKMTFSYGSNKRSDVESDTTFDAIKAGERTATTRYTTDGKIDYWSKAKVGDIIEFSNKDGDIVRVEVTKPLTKLPLNTDGETWSKKEGWSIDYFNKNVKPKLDKAYQLEYKLIGKAEPKKATPVETKTEPVLEEIKPPKAFELNDGQKKAFDKIMSFLDGSGITFTLTGSAGTGKTTLVNTIIAALKKAKSEYGSVVLSAPTHRANAVTKSKNKNQKVMTLHQLLSLAPEVDLENFDASKVKFNQIEKEKDPFPKSGLVIIDESSMISDALYDFLMDKVSEFPDVKILFLGDAAQLRPVTKDNKSSLHDSKALTQTDGQANLTKVERAKNPELLDESINLREKGSFTNNNNMKNSNGVAFTNSEAGFINRLIRMFKSQEFVDNRLLVRAVAYTNKRVTEINSKVRESLYGKDAPDYVVGDLLMGYNRFGKQDDKGNLPIANGIDYLVTSIGSEKTIDILGVQVKTASITIKDVYGLGGSNTLTVILPSNDAAIWQALGEKFQKLSTQAYAAKDKSIFDNEADKYVFPRDLKALVTPRNTSIKPFETTLIKQTINYGYAHTIHKSQGGTYTYVFVDEPSILSTKDLDTRKRLRYVGMTRAEKGAYILTTSEITGEPITEAKFPVATSVTDLKDTPVKQESIPVEPVVAEEVPVKQEEPIVEPTNKVDPKTFTNHSGGAYGADTMWDTVGREFGINNHNHYRDENNSTLSKKLKDAGVKAVTLTAAALNKARDTVNKLLGTNHKDDIAGNLQARNYYQVANSDGVFAIGSLTPNKKGVTGGTNTAIQLAIKLTDKIRPVYVWDTNTQRWYEFSRTKGVFQATTTPTLTKEFAGIGTRDIENYNVKNQLTGKFEPRKQYVGDEIANAAKQAIKDVYAKTLLGTTSVNEELDNELPVEDTITDDSPIVTGNKNAVIKVKSDVVVPSKFSNLVQGIKNFFVNSFKFKGEETTRTDSVESPLQFVKDALLDISSFQEAVPNSNYEMNKTVAKAYRGYLGQYYDELSNKLTDNLKLFFSEKKRLARFEKGDPLNRFEEGKVLNLVEPTDKGYEYNQHLLELATLAGLQWFLIAGQTERRVEIEDVAQLLGISEDQVTDELMTDFLNTTDMGQLSQGLTNTIKSFWGISGISTEMMAYTDGIPEAMAAEVIRAFTELEMITLTKVDHPTKPGQEVNRFEVNRFDNDALYSFPTAIQEVVLVESEGVTYFGDDIPPVPQTQLGSPTIKLSRKEKKAIAAANKTEVKTNVLQANIIMSLTQDALKIMFGGGIENEHMNKNTLASVQGENKTILNAYQSMVDMLSRVDNVSKTLGKDASEVVMRFPHTITKVGRLMMLGKYNIQSSKLLREVFLPTWSTLDLVNNQDHIDAFHLAVSQALGIKVHNEGPESINKLRVLLSGKLAPAITLVQDWMEATDNGENPIEFDGIELARIFKEAEENLTPNAFHALVEYVRYQRVEDKTKFTTGLYLEADGVTNGPGNAIEMLTLGKFTGKWITTVEKIGHSFAEPKAKHELDKQNIDLYGTAGVASVEPLQTILGKMKQSSDSKEIMSILDSLYSLMSTNVQGIKYDPSKLWTTGGVDANRNFFKNPLTILLYGSGINGIAGKATKQMTDNIYKLFSDANILLNSNDGVKRSQAEAMFPNATNPQETYNKFMSDLSTIMNTTIEYNGKSKQYFLSDVTHSKRSDKDLKLENFTFSGSEIDAITKNITKGLVDAMYQGAVETVGNTVMTSTKLIQQATQIQSILLEAAFKKAIQDKIASHKALDENYRAGDFISKQDFMDIMEELKVIAPYLKTPDQTFLAAKTKRYRNEKGSKVEYSRSLNDMFRTEPNMFIPTNAGVSGTPNLVIGMGDAYAILQAAIDESLVGNLWIYDGINMPLDKITDYAPKLNKAAFEAWQNNPLRVIEESFRSFMGAESMMKKALDETLNNEDLANQLNKSLRLYKTEDKLSSGNSDYALSIFGDLLNDLKNSADSIDARHAAIARMPNSVDQLAAAGVPYHNGITVDPTLDTPEKIAAQLNKYYQEELDKIKNKPKAEPVKEMTPEEMDPITKDMLSNTITDEISGVKILRAAGLFNLGKSINLSREQRKAYIQLVRSNKLDGYTVVFGSIEQIKKYRELQGYKSVDLDQETDNGFIDMNNKVIHLINPSVETLVHEMIHAATYGSVLNYYQNPSLNTKEVNDAIERTEGLMGEFLKLSPKELARLTPEARAAINNVKAAIEEPASNLDNSSAVVQAKALNEFMAWSLSNQELISTFRKVEMPAYLRIAKEVIDLIKKFFTFKDKATGETKEQDLTIPKDLFGNLLFNASVIINSAQPSLAETMAETTLFHSGTAKHITELRNTLLDKVVLFLNNTGQPMNISLYNSGFGKTLTEAYDTVSSLTPIFGISGVEETTLNYVVAALSTEIQIDPLTIDGIQTLYGHAVVELAKQVDAGTYPKAKYDALIGRIGNHKNIGGKSTLLPVFLGLGLIDTELRDALAKIDMPTKAKNTTGTLDAGLDNFFNKMLDGLFKALTGQRKANNVADALELLTERLTEIALKESRAINSPFNAPGNNADKANEWVSNSISKLGNKGLALGAKLETSNKLRVKQLGSAVALLSSLASETNGETVSRAAISIVNKTNAWKPFREFVTDLTNRTESNALVYDLIKKVRAAVQQLRQNYRTEVPKKIAKKFTRVLSNDEWSNLFRSMAKTDLAALIDIMSKEEILDLFTNPNSLNKQISSLENRIQNQDTTNWSLYQTKMKQLANYMNTGITGSNFLRNPYAIHGLLNEAKPKNFKVMGKDAVHSIDQLTTLYAIEGLSQQDKTDMAEMIKEESEALGFIIDYLVGQSAGEVLKAANNPVIQLNYYKGHIPQINKSGSSLLVATDDQMHNLKLRGYTRIGDYAGSNLDPNRIDKGYYFSTVSANTAVSQGTIQNVQKTISGVDDTYGFTVGSMVDRITDPAEVRRITVRLNKETNTIENLIPVFNGTGEVIAYERSMNPEMVAMLKPSEHLAEMIGVWRGRQIEEQIATEINKEVIDNHYTMWKNDITKKPSSQQEYVNILDPKQLDVIEQDMVSLFSFETRQYIANTYGSEFWVRKDVMNDMIGFRKASIADVFTGKTRLSKETQEVIKKVLVTAFGYEAYKYAVNSEKFIQNVTNEVRTLIIVKSIIVPMFNIASNIVQLIARGVPIKTILKAPTKILELRSYTQSQVKQVGLEAELRAASGNPSQQKVLEAQIQAIKDGHKRLSIWPLIEAGEFSTISDIGSNSEDIDLFSGNSENWLRNKIDKLPPALKTTVRYGFMTRDTALFQGLQKMVQYGDFIAKAVMYDDLLKRKGLTKEQALGKITDEFVNYDKLPGRFRGYLEDMGVWWFWNYKLRITKVALSIMRENPINALMLSVMPIPIGSGTPMGDNFVTKLLDGSLTGSIGPGMSLQAAQLTPVYNILN